MTPLTPLSTYPAFAPHIRLRIGLVCFAAHIAANLAMLGLLVQGMPPFSLGERVVYVAQHPLRWGLGWGVWMVAAWTLVLFYLAFADTLSKRGWTTFGVVLAAAGAGLDSVVLGVSGLLAPQWATLASSSTFYADLYAVWDRVFLVVSVGLDHGLYTLGGIVLCAVASVTLNFPRWLARLNAVVWGVAVSLAAAGLMSQEMWIIPASAVTFALFLPWLVIISYGWLSGTYSSDWVVHSTPKRLTLPEVIRSAIPKHPLPMRTLFRNCVLVNFAMPPEVLARHLPGPIEPDAYDGNAFLSVVIADMDRMRPAFLHPLFGITYRQVVYRAVVRCRGERGVHFLRSDADNPLMSFAGDWLTFFRFHTSEIRVQHTRDLYHFDLNAPAGHQADIHAEYDLSTRRKTLPESSCFPSLNVAQDHLVELFAAFAYDSFTSQLSSVHIKRSEWNIDVVDDRRAEYPFMQNSQAFPLGSTRLDSIFYIQQIAYLWHRLDPIQYVW